MGGLWGIVTVLGPVLLAAVLLYAVLRNKFQKNQAPKSVTERGTRQLHEQLDQEDKARERRDEDRKPGAF